MLLEGCQVQFVVRHVYIYLTVSVRCSNALTPTCPDFPPPIYFSLSFLGTLTVRLACLHHIV